MRRKLPNALERLLKPIYKSMQTWPIIGSIVNHIAHWILFKPLLVKTLPKLRNPLTAPNRISILETTVSGLAMSLQGVDSANLFIRHQSNELDNRLKSLTNNLEQINSRIEFIRDETLFELRKALRISPQLPHGISSDKTETIIEPRIINPKKLQQHPLRLNLGCGHITYPDMINIDGRELPGVDIVADIANLPFEPGTVHEIHASHLIEHFPPRYLLDIILPHWKNIIAPNGILKIITPDTEAMIIAHTNKEMSFDNLALVTFGKQEYDGDFHYAMFSPSTLQTLLHKAGFNKVEVICAGRVNGLCREMEVNAKKEDIA